MTTLVWKTLLTVYATTFQRSQSMLVFYCHWSKYETRTKKLTLDLRQRSMGKSLVRIAQNKDRYGLYDLSAIFLQTNIQVLMSNVVGLVLFVSVLFVGCIGAQEKILVPSIGSCSKLTIDMDRYSRTHSISRIDRVFGASEVDPAYARAWLTARQRDIESQQAEIDNCWRVVMVESSHEDAQDQNQ
jgi:hypothetical protein